MTIAANVIAYWISTAASIPSGWSRDTDVDGKHLKGIATSATNPGTTGGSATHTHTSPAHTHTIADHTHTMSTSVDVGNKNSASSGTRAERDHSHANATTSGASVSSTSNATVTLDNTSSDPLHYTAIAIKSGGATNFPNGCMLMFNSVTPPSGWALCDGNNGTPNMSGKYIKVAAASSDANVSSTSGANTHAHTDSTHTHATTAHTHTATNGSSGGSWGTSGSPTVSARNSHTHTVTTASAGSVTSSAVSVTISTDNGEPPYYTLAFIKNTSGSPSAVLDLIAIWKGTLATIPEGWILCDGNNGTPNLINVFIKGDTSTVGSTGGNTTHTHTPSAHNHTYGTHNHTSSSVTTSGSCANVIQGTGVDVALCGHTHTYTFTDVSQVSSDATITLDALSSSLPEYYEVAYIQLKVIPPSNNNQVVLLSEYAIL